MLRNITQCVFKVGFVNFWKTRRTTFQFVFRIYVSVLRRLRQFLSFCSSLLLSGLFYLWQCEMLRDFALHFICFLVDFLSASTYTNVLLEFVLCVRFFDLGSLNNFQSDNQTLCDGFMLSNQPMSKQPITKIHCNGFTLRFIKY